MSGIVRGSQSAEIVASSKAQMAGAGGAGLARRRPGLGARQRRRGAGAGAAFVVFFLTGPISLRCTYIM
eukprot:COSAG01_NODE_24391_length_780_cov_2.425844_1_plen_68_part_10